jgi:hypothetical protein
VVFLRRPGGQSQFSIWRRRSLTRERSVLQHCSRSSLTDLSLIWWPANAERAEFYACFSGRDRITPGDFVEMARVDARGDCSRRAKLCSAYAALRLYQSGYDATRLLRRIWQRAQRLSRAIWTVCP